MYDLPELQAANDALWSALATRLWARGIDAPAALSRTAAPDAIWADPALLLGQTCGYPLVTSLRGRVTLVATPCYCAPGCEAGRYRSAVIVRAADPARALPDLRGRRCAMNSPCSNSGMNVLRAAIAPFAQGGPRFFDEIVTTGAHVASITAVADGRADVTACDCVTWAHLRRFRPVVTEGLRVLAWTSATPGLPLISAGATDLATLHALTGALADVAKQPPMAEIRQELLLDGFIGYPVAAYDSLLDLERQACAAGYPQLR